MSSVTSNTELSIPTPLKKAFSGRSTSMISRVLQPLAAILIGLTGISAASAQPLYSVTDLGTLPDSTFCIPNKLNDRGEVVGLCWDAIGDYHYSAFVWRNGAMSAVGKFAKGNYSTALAIDSRGKIAGAGDNGNGRPQLWVTSASGLINVFPNNGGNTIAVSLADNGVIGGYYIKGLTGNFKGAIWTPDAKDPRKYGITDLPILAGGVDPTKSYALPFAFNNAGQGAGYGVTDQIGQHATFWNNDATHSIVDLGFLPGDGGSVAWGMNDLGQTVGVSNGQLLGPRAVMWNNDAAHTPFALQPLAGDQAGEAFAINNIGQILGRSYTGTYQPTAASGFDMTRQVVWRDGNVFDLQMLLDPFSGAGWTINNTTAINNVGQIVATGVLNGQTRAIMLSPLTQ